MFAGELKARQQRLQREQQKRAEEAKRKADRQRVAAERQKARELQREEDQRQRRLAEAQAEEQAKLSREALIEANNGVFIEARLTAVESDEKAMKLKGIRRAADKICLPASMGDELMAMDAPKNGAMLFELSTPSGRVTHTGVLEFTAPPGQVLMPRKVVRSLWGREATGPVGAVLVRYKLLEKGTFARLQPATTAFQADCGGEVREILERALLQHSCLTEGDWLEVVSAGKLYDFRVESLQPHCAVSILDTDVEAEVAPSMENEAEFAAAEEAARRKLDEEARVAMERAAQEALEAARAAEAQAGLERIRQSKATSLPDEPDPSTNSADFPITSCLVRLPEGGRVSRRFRLSDSATHVFDWLDSLPDIGLTPGSYRLVAQHPRRILDAASAAGSDLRTVGLSAGQEALFLEPLQQ